MKLASYFEQIFIRVFSAFIILNLIAAVVFLYHHTFNMVSLEVESMNRLLDKEKSYFSYIYLNKRKDENGTRVINKINNQLELIKVYEEPIKTFIELTPIKITFAGKNLKVIYPQLVLNSSKLIAPIIALALYLLFSISLLLYALKRLKRKITKEVVSPLYELDHHLNKGFENFVNLSENIEITEIARVFKNLNKEVTQYVKLKNQVIEIEKDVALTKQAKQVAHDIRSPLEALKSITNNLETLDSMTKSIVNTSISRINEIANSLLDKNRNKIENKSLCLRILLEEILYNKEQERNVLFNINLQANYSDTFIMGNESELYRSISNLLNNAIESQIIGQERVDVSLSFVSSCLTLTIQDYGTGMDNELLKKVLIGGATTKKSGNGIGLSSSKNTFNDLGANFKVSSLEGEGTKVVIEMNTVLCPSWFSETIVLTNKIVNIIDDDISFHRLYEKKLTSYNLNISPFNGKEVSYNQLDKNSLCLVDYDLGATRTGLDIILEYKLSLRSYLITSNYLDEEIQKICVANSIKIIPKQIFNNIRIEKLPKEELSTSHVLIDDDDLIHLSWQMEASRHGIDLETYHSVDEFLSNSSKFNPNSMVYIDSNLGNGIKGEVESEKISLAGFKNIYLATGYSASDIEKPTWIKEIVGKRASF